MQTDANSRRETLTATVVGESTLDRHRALQRQVDVIERQEEAVTRCLDLLAAVLGDQGSQRLVMPPQQA